MQPWQTAIVDAGPAHLRVRGHDVLQLMQRATFTDMIFLLHHTRLPTPEERRLIDAILIGSADHGPGAPSCAAARLAASGNRQSLSAAVAAGVLSIGDEHGGAGSACMELIAAGIARARSGSTTFAHVAARLVEEAQANKQRLPGFGHRVHTETDPRVNVLFNLAGAANLAGDGIAFARALERVIAERIKPLPLNIDGALGAVLHDLGFPPMVGRLLFIVSRVAGLSAEVLEEYTREEPMRIRFPVEYDGVPPRQDGGLQHGTQHPAGQPGTGGGAGRETALRNVE
jgi:citrate synthase